MVMIKRQQNYRSSYYNEFTCHHRSKFLCTCKNFCHNAPHISFFCDALWGRSSYEQATNLSRIVGKLDFCLCENKGADQLRSNCEADQRLCFRYTDSAIPLLLK